MLFQHEFTGEMPDFRKFFEWKSEDPEVVEFARDIVTGTVAHLEEIDARIKKATEHWDFGRLAAVDRGILRTAAYELLFRKDIPPAVAINEALEIAKKFSTEESASFINGILDKISKGGS